MVKTASTVFVISFVAVLVACSSEDAGSSREQAKTAAPASSAAVTRGARVSVTADKTHAVQPGDEITLTIAVAGFRLSPESVGGTNQEGVGHYRVYLDDASGEDYIAAGAQPTTKVTIPQDINDGSHDLRVVLHNNDKSPLEPRVDGSVLLIVYRL